MPTWDGLGKQAGAFKLDQRLFLRGTRVHGGTNMPAHPGLPHRLRILKVYAGAKTEEELARMIGTTKNNLNNMMRGRDLSKEVALKIHERFPQITLEWLWLAETDHLRVDVERQLAEIGAKIAHESRPGRGRRARR